MASGSIGIKLADNKFFPIMSSDTEGSKTLELTTVRESQTSVQIDLYRSKDDSPDQTVDGAKYIGTLFIEDISEKPAGDPTIRLKINLSEDNNLSAEATDLDSGTKQSLNVSLKTLDKNAFTELPDFDLTDFPSDLSEDDFSAGTGAGMSDADFSADFGESAASDSDFTSESAVSSDFGTDFSDFNSGFSDFNADFDTGSPTGSGSLNAFDNFDNLNDAELSGMDTEKLMQTESGDNDFQENDFFAGQSQDSVPPAGLYDAEDRKRTRERKGIFMPAWLCVLILVVGIALLAAALLFAWKLFFANSAETGDAARQQVSAVERQDSQTQQTQADAQTEQSAQTAQSKSGASAESGTSAESGASAAKDEPTPPPVSEQDTATAVVEEPEPVPPREPEPAPITENVFYRIKWGDTLWDLAETYYRNPWRYTYIARYNDVKDPSLIVVGKYLVIPAE